MVFRQRGPPVRRRRTLAETLAEEEVDARLQIEAVSRIPTFNSIHKIFTNQFYTGKVPGNDGMWVQSISHESLVSEDLFNQVQEKLRKRTTSAHSAELLDHPLRGIAHCAYP